MQRATIVASADLPFRLLSVGQHLLAEDGVEGMDLGVQFRNAIQDGLGELDGRELLLPDQVGDLSEGEVGKIPTGGGHESASVFAAKVTAGSLFRSRRESTIPCHLSIVA